MRKFLSATFNIFNNVDKGDRVYTLLMLLSLYAFRKEAHLYGTIGPLRPILQGSSRQMGKLKAYLKAYVKPNGSGYKGLFENMDVIQDNEFDDIVVKDNYVVLREFEFGIKDLSTIDFIG
jgi:hypothetical protein